MTSVANSGTLEVPAADPNSPGQNLRTTLPVAGGGGFTPQQTFITSSQDLTPPTAATFVEFTAAGGGGAGIAAENTGTGSSPWLGGGGGGGAQFRRQKYLISSLPAAPWAITIGAGGNAAGVEGQNTTIGSFLSAKGSGGNYASTISARQAGGGSRGWDNTANVAASQNVDVTTGAYGGAGGNGNILSAATGLPSVGTITKGGVMSGGSGGGGGWIQDWRCHRRICRGSRQRGQPGQPRERRPGHQWKCDRPQGIRHRPRIWNGRRRRGRPTRRSPRSSGLGCAHSTRPNRPPDHLRSCHAPVLD